MSIGVDGSENEDFEMADEDLSKLLLLCILGKDIQSYLDQHSTSQISVDIDFRKYNLFDESLLREEEPESCIVKLLYYKIMKTSS